MKERTSHHSALPILDFHPLAPVRAAEPNSRLGYLIMTFIYRTLTLNRTSGGLSISLCASLTPSSMSRKALSKTPMLRCRPKRRNSIIYSLPSKGKTLNLTRCSTITTSENSSLKRLSPLQRIGVSLQLKSTDIPYEQLQTDSYITVQ